MKFFNKLIKFIFIFLAVFGLVFSNLPYEALTIALKSYVSSRNVVDKIWMTSNDSNVVDKFIPFETVIRNLKIKDALAVSNGDGKIFYSISANTTPRTRDYISSTNSFNTAVSTVVGATALQVVTKASPTKDEMIAGYVNSAGTLQVACWNGTSWTNEWSVAAGGTGTTRRFDIAYETNSGDVIVAYSRNAAATNAVDYRTKLGSTGCGTANWAAAASVPTTTALTTGTVHWVKMASDRRTAQNLISIIWADSNADLGASIWSGSAFGQFPTTAKMEQSLEVVTAAQDVEDFDVEYESTSGDVMVVWANSAGANGTNGAFYNVCTGGTSTCTWGTRTAMPTVIDDATHLDIAGDPNSDKILYGAIGNAGSDMSRGVWSGSAWTNTANADISSTAPTAGTKFIAVGWLNNGATNRGVLVYYDSGATNIGWHTVSGTTWTAQTDWASTPVFGTQKNYDIRMDPINKDRLIFTVNDANSDIFAKRLIMDAAGAFTWSNADGGAAIEANTGSATYKSFNFEYNRYIPIISTLATGSDPGATTIAPGAAATDVDLFTLQTNSGTETITSVTVNLSTNSGIGLLAITDNANTVLGSTASPVTGSNAITVSGMSAGTTLTTFKVRATPLSHVAMPAPAGGAYAITAPVTSWVGTGGYTHAGSDTNPNALTIDNNSPAGTTGAGATSGENAQSVVNWTNPGDGDFQQVYIYCKTSSMISGEAPAEGADPAVDATACDATARMKYKGTVSPQTITGLTNGTPYYFRIYGRDTNGNFTAYSATQEVTGTPSAPAATLTISASAGSKVATKNSGDVNQYAHDTACTGAATCAAFTLAASGGAVNVTSIKVTGNGTVLESNELSNVNLYYDFDGNWSDAGVETPFGAQALFAPDETATISGTLNISSGQTAYIYVRYDLVAAVYPIGGATVNFQIAAAGDVISDGTESGTGTLAGTQTIKPQITGYTNSTEPALDYAGACTGCGARIGPYSTTQHQTIVISGYGFGSDPGVGLKDSATNKVEIVGAATTVLGDDGSASTNVSAWSNTSITIRTNSDLATNTDTDWGTNFGGATALKVTAGGQAVPTNLNFYIFPQITSLSTNTGVNNGAREYSASDNHGVVILNGTRFGSAQGTGYVRTLGCDSTTCLSPTGSVAIDSWSNIAIAARVPTVIADNSYTGAVDMQQGTGGNSKTHTFSTLRILPRIISTGPVDTKGGQSQAVTITGNHFCQDATCADYATDSDDATFNAVSGKASYTAVSDTSISLSVPATATDGNLIVKSDSANGGTVYDSNSYSYNVKFGPTTPTGSSAGGSNNPTLNGNAFSDGTDGDTTHVKTHWQLAHSTDGDWSTPEWSRTTTTGLTSTVVDTTDGGAFANGDAGQTALDCGTTYKGRLRYMDNGNAGADTQTWEWSSYSAADYTFSTASCNNLTVGATGTQTANITRGTNTNYLGGSFTLTTNNSAATITSIKISNIGNITAYNNLNNVKLYYDTDGVWSGIFTETQLGSTQGSFASGDTVTFGSLSLGITNAAITYIYVVSDIDADPTSGQLIDIQITNPSTDVVVTGASNSDTLAKAITGSTTVANPNMNVASAGTQTANMSRGSTAQYVGGSFTLTMASATGTLTSFAITDNGTVNANTNLNNVKLYYDTDGVWSGTFTETQLGTPQTFNVSEKATFSTLSLGLTTSATYIYVVFDVASGATAGQTIEIRVAASGDVVGTGFNTSGTFPLDISGATTIADPSLTVATNGTQATNLNSGDTAQNIGGSFTFTLTGATGTLNSFIISEMGNVGATANLTNVTLQSDIDGAYPGTDVLGCTALSFNVSQQVSCTPTGGLPLSTTARYVYVIVNLGSGATGGETIEVQITNPSTDVSVTGASNTDTGIKAITGTTTIKPQITSYTNSTEPALDYAGACTGCGARIGPYSTTQHQTIVISGYGFGSDPGVGLKDSATNKVEIVGAATTVLGDDGSASTNVSAWSNTSITIRTNSDLATNTDTDWGTNFGGATALKVTAGGQAVPTNLNFYIFPQIISLSPNTGVNNGAREYSASDNHGVVTLNGTRFGSAQGTGYVRTLGCDSTTCLSPTGSVAIDSWSNIAIAARVPTVIADYSYTGAVDMQQGTGGNSKTHTFSTLRILPRIAGVAPASGVVGTDITITGDHFCQSGTCPADLVTWNNVADDGYDVELGTTDATLIAPIPTHTTIYADAPNISEGSYSVTVTSYNLSYVSNNNFSFEISTSKPNLPTNNYQMKVGTNTAEPPLTFDPKNGTNSDGQVAVMGGFNQSNVWFRTDMSGPLSGGELYYPQVEAKPTGGTPFECSNASPTPCSVTSGAWAEGSGVAYNGTAVQGVVQLTGLSNGTTYYWQARVRNSAGVSNWVSFGGNLESETDFYIDTTAPTLTPTCPTATFTASTADITWSTSETVTKQVQYGTDSSFVTSTCMPAGGSGCGDHSSTYTSGVQTVQLTGLTPNATYYYRVRSRDQAGSETIVGYGLGNDSCTFATSKANMRTVEYIITGETGAVTAETFKNFQVYITEQGTNIQNAFVEISGIAGTGGGASMTLGLKVEGETGTISYTNYTVAIDNAIATPFTILHKIDNSATDLYIAPTQSTQNKLYINPSSGDSVYIASAKIVVTYYYTPQ